MDSFSSALDIASTIKSKEISPVEVVQHYLDRIDKHDGELNSYVTVAGDEALAAAKEAEAAVTRGDELPAFHGVPIGIKDLIETAGMKTTFSSRSYEDYVPDFDAHVVRRIKEAGFILLGKTNTSEFGTFPIGESELNGACRNPWDTSRTSGGSSGGSGASVAAGLTPIAHGMDGGASIRIPASCCGIFGLKTSRGRISMGPELGEEWAGFSVHGPISRTVADSAALLDVMAGYEVGDPYWLPALERPFLQEARTDPGNLRIGVITASPTGVPIDPAVVSAVEDAVGLMELLGHRTQELALDWEDPDLTSHFIKVVATTTAYHQDVDLDKVEPANKALAEAGDMTSSRDYVRAILELQRITRAAVAMWDEVDIVVTPTLALPPVEIGWMFEPEDPWEQLIRAGMFIPFTPIANITGQPAASVPLVWSDEGLPLGVQLIGPPAGEDVLFRLSAQLEQARPWADRHPPGFE
ncbi:MAG TPA: amidase [Actinomycetota bacterium]|nr:amidase [Actinomycetota bacterium]